MAFTSYLRYDEYIMLGGTVSEDAFPVLERKAQRWVDYFTFDRVKQLETVPDEVKEVLVEFIERLYKRESVIADGESISKYSNGVEDITYRKKTEKEVSTNLAEIANRWLPDYLTNRSVNFNVSEYLQSNSNDSQ